MNFQRLREAVISGIFWMWLSFQLANYFGVLRPLDSDDENMLRKVIQTGFYETNRILNVTLTSSIDELNITNVHAAKYPSKYSEFLPKALEASVMNVWQGSQVANDSVYFRNISSTLYGEYEKINVDLDPVDMPLNYPHDNGTTSARNGTDKLPVSGELKLVLEQTNRTQNDVYELFAGLYFGHSQINAVLYGVYLDDGHVIMSTHSLKFSGDMALAFLLPENRHDSHVAKIANATRYVLAASLNDTLEAKERSADMAYVNLLSARADRCDLVLYGKTEPIDLTEHEVRDVEDELQDPIGRPISSVPNLRFEGVLYSPDCGISYGINIGGQRTESFVRYERVLLTGFAVLAFALVYITAKQFYYTESASAVSRISFWYLLPIYMCDCGIVFALSTMRVIKESGIATAALILMLAILLVAVLEGRYLVNIYLSQEGDSLINWLFSPNILTRRLSPEQDGNNAAAQSREVTWNDAVAVVFKRGAILSFFLVFILLVVHSHVVEAITIFVVYSYWAPQIYRNVRRGYRTPMLPSYIVASTLLRLVPVLYLCFWRPDTEGSTHRPLLGWIVLGWQLLQMSTLLLQRLFGPQFFVPSWFIIPAYDYHPLISDDLEQSLHIANLPASHDNPEEESDPGHRLLDSAVYKTVDCSICMNPTRLVMASENRDMLTRSIWVRRKYMVTPCRHVFHTECLEQWMRTRLQCPVCRNQLPPA